MKRLLLPLFLLFSSAAFAQIPGYNVPDTGTGLKVCIGPGSNTMSGPVVSYAGSCLTMTQNKTNFGYIDAATGLLTVNTTGAPSGACPIFEADTDFFQVNKVRDKRPSICGGGGSGSGPILETNGVNNTAQNVLNLQNGNGTTISNPSAGNVIIDGPTHQVNGVNNSTQGTLNLQNGNGMTITNPSGGNVSIAGPSLQTNGIANSAQTTLNISGGANVTATNPSAGNVTIAVSSPSAISLPSSGLLAEYRMPPTEVSTTTLTDSSGNGNDGTFPGGGNNPSRIAATGGLSFAHSSSQFITLPSALNSCQSFLFGYNYTLGNSFSGTSMNTLIQEASPQAGTVISIGFVSTTGAPYGYQQSNAGTIGTVIGATSGPAGSTAANNSGQGTHVLVTTGGGVGVSDAIYFDGSAINILYPAGPTVNNVYNPGSSHWQLGGAAFNTQYFQGNMYYFACWNRALASYEVAQATNVVTTILNQRGITTPVNNAPQFSTTNTGDYILTDGDSIMWGYNDNLNGVQNWPFKMVFTNSATLYDIAQPAEQLVTVMGPNGANPDSYYNPSGGRNVVLQAGGRNDIVVGSLSNAAVEGATQNFCKLRIQKGFICGIVSLIASTTTANKLAINAFERQHWREWGQPGQIFFVDWGSDPSMSCDTCTASFPDSIHPSLWQTFAMQQYYTQRAINRILGPKDFTTATTYSSVLGAATTVTAATDTAQIGTSGHSTATYTFTSNPFQTMGPLGNGVGVSVTCTGITPAGYNTTFTTVTSNATTITGIINAASLGAGSVFGTCSAPMVEDAIAILNVGVANVAIGTACGYTTQRITLKNVNAGTTTIVPTSMPNESSETIDGSANLSIAQNQVRILESILTTPSTPQCGWKVIQ